MPGSTDVASAAGSANPVGMVSQALSAIEGGFQLFHSLKQEKDAKRALANLHDPFYKIQNEFYQNRDMAGDLAQGGLPTASKDYYTSEANRGLSAGISGGLQSGASPNDISKYLDIHDRGIDRTAATDAEQHIKNIQYYMDANKELAGQKNIQFGFNEVRPYERKYARYSQQAAAGQQNAYNGANQVIGSIGAFGTSMENNSLLNNLFKDSNMPLNNSTPNVSTIANMPFNNVAADPFQTISSQNRFSNA